MTLDLIMAARQLRQQQQPLVVGTDELDVPIHGEEGILKILASLHGVDAALTFLDELEKSNSTVLSTLPLGQF